MRTNYRNGLLGFFVATTLSTSGDAIATPPCRPETYMLTLESVTIEGQPIAAATTFQGGISYEGGRTYSVDSYDPDTQMPRSRGVYQ